MDTIRLVYPTKEYEAEALAYVQEHLEYQSQMNGSGNLGNFTSNYDEWLKHVEMFHTGVNLDDSFVQSTTYFAVRLSDNKVVGMIDIRHALNDYLLNFGGNIGYGVRPTMRKQGYATQMLSLALEVCKSLSLNKVLITCDKDNEASSRVVLNNGGHLENEIYDLQSKKIIQRYWIDLV